MIGKGYRVRVKGDEERQKQEVNSKNYNISDV